MAGGAGSEAGGAGAQSGGAPQSVDDFLNEAESEIDATGAAVSETREKVQAANALRMGRDRSALAKIIIWTYAIVVGLVVLYTLAADVVVLAVKCSAVDIAKCGELIGSWDKKADNLLEIITTAVIPIVTLMLGFYFGTEKSGGDNGQQ